MTTEIQARMERQFAVEQFYYDEAAMLDSRNYSDWIKLFAQDIHYWMPVRRTMTTNELSKEFTQPGSIAFFDDDLAALEARVRKLDTGYSWAEDPPSRQRHIVTNVRVIAEKDGELEVESNFHLYRTRLNSEEDNWLGMRRDILRKEGDSYKIANRKIFLDMTVLLSRNLSNFF